VLIFVSFDIFCFSQSSNLIHLCFSYAGRDSAAATATGIKSSHYLEQKTYMQQAMAI
jgi:hypothetical protein